VPRTLVDGSAVRAVRVTLEGVEQPAVLTSVVVVGAGELGAESTAGDCVRGRFGHSRAPGSVVVRTGVSAGSVTFREASGLGLAGCIDSAGSRPDDRRWCGGAYGSLAAGRLNDPRLDIGCVNEDDEPIGSIWVEPERRTRYVVLLQPGYAEVYESGADLPVRVASTSGVDLSRSRATFELLEHDRAGALVRRYRIEAFVAG